MAANWAVGEAVREAAWFVPQRLPWWKMKLAAAEKAMAVSAVPAVLPVRLSAEALRSRGEPVTVLLRTGHMLKVSHGFDATAFARVVALLEGG